MYWVESIAKFHYKTQSCTKYLYGFMLFWHGTKTVMEQKQKVKHDGRWLNELIEKKELSWTRAAGVETWYKYCRCAFAGFFTALNVIIHLVLLI